MAEQGGDGSIIINSGIDTSGFEKDSEKLKKAAEDVASSIEQIGEKAAPIKLEPEGPTKDDIKRAVEKVDPPTIEAEVEPQGPSEQDIHDAFMETYGRAHPQPVEGEDMTSGALTRATASLQKQIDGTLASLDKLSNASLQGFQTAGAVNAFNSKIEQSKARVDAARQALKEFSEAEIPTDQYSKFTAAADKAEQTLEALRDQQDFLQDTGVDESSKQWQNLAAKIEEAENKMYYYRAKAEEMRENGVAFVDPKDTDQFQQMTASLKEAEQELQRNASLIDQEAIAQERLNVKLAQEDVINAKNGVQRALAVRALQNAQNRLAAVTSKQTTPAPDESRATAWQRFAATVTGVGATIKSSFSSIGSAASGVFGKIGSIAHGALNKVGKIGSKAFSGIKSAISGAAGKLKSFVTGANRSNLSVKSLVKGFTSLGRMLITRVKRTFISAVFKDLQASIQALAKFDAGFNTAMSNMKNAASELSANVAVAFGSLVKTFEPIITKLLNALTDAMTKVNAVFASLRGESTVTVAAKQTASYADSLDDAAHNAEDTRHEQEKLNATLSSFDELHTLSSAADDASSDSSAGDAENTIYKSVPVNQILGDASALSRIANTILDSVGAGKWAAVGAAIGEGINGIVDKINEGIPIIRAKAEAFARALAEGLNGLIGALDGSKIGQMFAGGINLIFGTANTFLKTFDFGKLGKLISDTINGFFANVEWDTVAQTFINGFKGMLTTVRTLAEGLDWGVIGGAVNTILGELNKAFEEYDFYELTKTLGSKFSEAITSIDWGLAGRAMANGINSIVSSIHGIVDGIDWDALGRSFADSVNNFFSTIDWAEAAHTLSDSVKGVLNMIASAIEEIDWMQLGTDVATFIGEIDWAGVAEALFRGIGAALGGLAAFLMGLIGDALEELVAWWYDKAYENGEFTISGLLDGIAEALANIGMWIYDHIWVPFRDAFQKAFGIDSPSKEMKPFGEYIIEGLKAGITNTLRSIGNWIKNKIFTPIKNGLTKAFDIASNAAGAVKSIGQAIIEGVKTGITNKITGIKNWLKTNVTDKLVDGVESPLDIGSPSKVFQKIGGFIMAGLGGGLEDGWKDVTGLIDSKTKGFIDAGKGLIDSLKSGINSTWDSLVSNMFEKMANLTKWAEGKHFLSAGVQIVEGLKAGISSKWDALVADVWTKVGNLQNWFTTELFFDAGQNIAQGLKDGIYWGWFDVEDMCRGLARDTLNTIRAEFEVHSPSKATEEIGGYLTEGLVVGIKDGAGGVFSTVSALADGVVSGMDQLYEIGSADLFTGLDATAEQLAEIARALLMVDRAMPDFAAVGVPGVMLGQIAPPKTAGDADGSGGKVTRLLEQIARALTSEDETSTPQPVRLETKVVLDRRELGRAIAEYDMSNNRIRNGSLTGGNR